MSLQRKDEFVKLKNLYLICGKSGCGKTTLVDSLEEKMHYSVLPSYTTRQPRTKNDTSHIYATIDDYVKAKNENIIATSTVFDHNYYWSTIDQINKYDLYVIDKDGINNLLNNDACTQKIVTIYIDADYEICIKRMKKRGDKESKIWQRLKNDSNAFNQIENMVDFIVDGNRAELEVFEIVSDIIDKCEAIQI